MAVCTGFPGTTKSCSPGRGPPKVVSFGSGTTDMFLAMSGVASTARAPPRLCPGDNQLVAARAGGREIRRQIGPLRLVESHPPHVDVSEIGTGR